MPATAAARGVLIARPCSSGASSSCGPPFLRRGRVRMGARPSADRVDDAHTDAAPARITRGVVIRGQRTAVRRGHPVAGDDIGQDDSA